MRKRAVRTTTEPPGLSGWESRRTEQRSAGRRATCYRGGSKFKFEHTDLGGRAGCAVRNGQLAAGEIRTVPPGEGVWERSRSVALTPRAWAGLLKGGVSGKREVDEGTLKPMFRGRGNRTRKRGSKTQEGYPQTLVHGNARSAVRGRAWGGHGPWRHATAVPR